MAATTRASLARVNDIVSNESVVTRILGPRILNATETRQVATEVIRMEAFLTGITAYVEAHKTQGAAFSSYDGDVTNFHLLRYKEGATLAIGQLTISNVEMVVQRLKAAYPTDANIGVEGAFEVRIDGALLASITCNTYALHAFLRALPLEVYHAMGSMFEEVGSVLYKGGTPASSVTTTEAAALIRIQDRILKQSIEKCASVQLADKTGLMSGPDVYVGSMKARALAMTVIDAMVPAFSSWLFRFAPLGTRDYQVEASA